MVQLFFDSETQEKYVFVKGLGVFKSASDSEEWVSVGNEGTPDLTNIDGISDSKPGWSSAGSNFTLSKNPVTNEL